MNEKERRICELEIMAGTFFFFVGEGGGEPPPFHRIINNFLLFYHGQLIRTYIKNTILESSSKRRLVYLRT